MRIDGAQCIMFPNPNTWCCSVPHMQWDRSFMQLSFTDDCPFLVKNFHFLLNLHTQTHKSLSFSLLFQTQHKKTPGPWTLYLSIVPFSHNFITEHRKRCFLRCFRSSNLLLLQSMYANFHVQPWNWKWKLFGCFFFLLSLFILFHELRIAALRSTKFLSFW